MRGVCRVLVALAGVMACVVPRVEAAWLSADAPVEVSSGWARIAGHYEGGGAAPIFRAVARCGGGASETHVLDGILHVASSSGELWLDLPGTPDHLVPDTTSCGTPELSIEMLVDATVIASAPVPRREVAVRGPQDLLATPPPPARADRRFRLKGEKYAAPLSKRTEAGVEWALDSRVSIQLNYERTAQAPMMPFDHDDGFLTRLRIGF